MSTIQVNAIQSSTGTQEVTQTTIFSGTPKAWSNLDGSGTIAERDSFNISSYSDLGTGHYQKNLSISMVDGNYVVNGISSGGSGSTIYAVHTDSATTPATSNYTIYVKAGSPADNDALTLIVGRLS